VTVHTIFHEISGVCISKMAKLLLQTPDFAWKLEGPILHQIVIFFGAHFSNLIVCIESELCQVRDNSLISKYLRPTLNFHIVKYYFYTKNTFYYVKSMHWAQPLRDLEIIYNFA